MKKLLIIFGMFFSFVPFTNAETIFQKFQVAGEDIFIPIKSESLAYLHSKAQAPELVYKTFVIGGEEVITPVKTSSIFWKPKVAYADELSEEEILINKILATANKYGINSKLFLATAKCESGLEPDAVGDKNKSFGIFQIHLPSHPTVTKAQALNPDWAIEWSAEKFKENPRLWSCYKKIVGRNLK